MTNPLDDLAPPSSNPLDSLAPPTSNLVASNPAEYDPTSEAYKQQYGPTGSFLENALAGVGKLYTDVGLGARQAYGQVTGGDMSGLNQEAADKRALDAPLAATGGGKVGQFAGALPLAFVPGANSYAGAALIGAGLGATQPTVGDESRTLNAGIGGALGVGGKYVGDTLSSWLTQRAAAPFTGWRQATGNRAAAQAVGSDAPVLNQPAINDAFTKLEGTFEAARSPDVSIDMGGQTAGKISSVAQGLNQSSRTALEGNSEVADLMAHLRNGTANAQQLGTISSRLGKEASAQMSGKDGDRALGQALFAVKDHVDDLVGGSITDPALAEAYTAARPQYRNLLTMTNRPTILNSSTGALNMRALGNYLQKYDKAGYTRGGNTSPLYEAARAGQRTGLGAKASPPILQPGKFLAFHAQNSAVLGAMTGSVSRLGAPISPVIKYGLPGAAEISAPVALPYLTQ